MRQLGAETRWARDQRGTWQLDPGGPPPGEMLRKIWANLPPEVADVVQVRQAFGAPVPMRSDHVDKVHALMADGTSTEATIQLVAREPGVTEKVVRQALARGEKKPPPRPAREVWLCRGEGADQLCDVSDEHALRLAVLIGSAQPAHRFIIFGQEVDEDTFVAYLAERGLTEPMRDQRPLDQLADD